jgi:hypothetical protein
VGYSAGGPHGTLRVTSRTTLQVSATIPAGDPLHGPPARQRVGLVVMEFAARRHVRVNGTLLQAGQERLVINVKQAYGNCPQYIQQRALLPDFTTGRTLQLTGTAKIECGEPGRPATTATRADAPGSRFSNSSPATYWPHDRPPTAPTHIILDLPADLASAPGEPRTAARTQ